jgi:hypothetical protein
LVFWKVEDARRKKRADEHAAPFLRKCIDRKNINKLWN